VYERCFSLKNQASNKYYYHHDALGSTMGLTDTNKTVVQSYLYDDFGNLWGGWGLENNQKSMVKTQ
jgi:hypothetical protein